MTTTTQKHEETGTKFDQNLARIAVGAYDDAQQTRKAMLNRVRDIVRKKNEGIDFDEVEDEKDPDERNYSSEYSDENLENQVDEMLGDGKISDREHEYLLSMLETAELSQQIESTYKDVMNITTAEPVYREYLSNVTGVSSVLTARLLNQFGYCEDFDRVSDLWSYCGLAPGSKREKGEKLGYSPDAKKLGWLVGDTMMKMGDRSAYRREFFDPYKSKQVKRMGMAEEMTDEQLNQKNWTPPESQGHAHNRAIRYLAKKFLKHYWAISRDIKGLDVPDEHVIAFGGHKKKTDCWENPFYAKQQLQ